VTARGAVAEAVRLLAGNVLLLGAVVFTVSVPVSVLGHVVGSDVFGPNGGMRAFQVSTAMDALLAPIATGALIHAVAVLRRGGRPTYRDAMRVGLGNAGRLFKANVITGSLILVALLAGIVPGVLLAVRWALVDPVVILEGVGWRAAMRRSTDLTRGRRWTVARALIVCLACMGIASLGSSVLQGVPPFDVLPVRVALDGAVDVVDGLIDVVMVLFYCEFRSREIATAASAAA
jgi:hypothetical protein